MARDTTAQRIAALESVVICLLGERYGPQIGGQKNLATFFQNAYDIGGRNESLQELETQAERRRSAIQRHGIER